MLVPAATYTDPHRHIPCELASSRQNCRSREDDAAEIVLPSPSSSHEGEIRPLGRDNKRNRGQRGKIGEISRARVVAVGGKLCTDGERISRGEIFPRLLRRCVQGGRDDR